MSLVIFLTSALFVLSICSVEANSTDYEEKPNVTMTRADTVEIRRSVGRGPSSDCCSEKTFLVGTQKVSWFEGFVICQQNGMELASLHSSEEEATLHNILKDYPINPGPANGFWLAGTRNGACPTDFVWFNNGRPFIHRNFAPGQPDNAGGNERCVNIFINNQNEWAWNDAGCGVTNLNIGFICQNRCCCSCTHV